MIPKRTFKKAMDDALGKLTEHVLLMPEEKIFISYDVGIVNDKIVPVVNRIGNADETEDYFTALDFPEKQRQEYFDPIVGSQGQQAVAKDATPQQAALMLRTYWEIAYK